MRVSSVMQRRPVTLPKNATIHSAALKMKKENVGSILIVDEEEKLCGIVTDRDIAIAVAADEKDPDKAFASDIMTQEPITIDSNASMEAALHTMSSGNVKRLPVCRNGRIVGLLSSTDLARELREELNQFIDIDERFTRH